MTPEELAKNLDDVEWRLSNLYKIIIKGDDQAEDAPSLVITFKPNEAQDRLLASLWYRNIILKARQLGFTTLVTILWLDTALFSKNPIRCGIIAQDKESAENIFREKVRFAYDNLPEELRDRFPLKRDSASELVFAHNDSSIRVATSMRSGTIHRLLVSEFGGICAKSPEKAQEIVTGSLPTVPDSGIAIIESTAKGQDGHFYTMTEAAKALKERGVILTRKDYRLHFYAWWSNPVYVMDPAGIELTEADLKYFNEVEATTRVPLSPAQRAWYVGTRNTTFSGDPTLMWQEYPSCISGDVLVGTPNGIMPIRDVTPDGKIITDHFSKGVRPVFKVRTRLGYTVTCTIDHPIKTPSGGFRKIQEGLCVGDSIVIGRPMLSTQQQTVTWSPAPFVEGNIHVTPEFAEFLGMFMGDGSFYKGTISVACDAGDEDTVAAVEGMFKKFLGGSSSRVVGEKRGCTEVRRGSKWFAEPFLAIGLVEHRSAGGLKRKVHVPQYIFNSPEPVIAAFLRGLFEADGFAARDGTSIKFFSKHEQVVSQVQLLLLALGIESRASCLVKKSGSGSTYEGWELVLRADGVRKFATNIGFISRRKQDRASLSLSKRKSGSTKTFKWADDIVSIEAVGEADVYDITTATHEFDAGGIVVHNCPEEAFQVSTEGCYYATQIAVARKQGRILTRIPREATPVNTFWDLGRGDMTSVWFHQRVGPENRFIKYIEASGEELDYYASELQKTGFIFGTHYLPHDAEFKRLGQSADTNRSQKQMLEALMPGQRFKTVSVVTSVITGIQATRNVFNSCWFDQTECDLGIKRLSNYKKVWNKTTGSWTSEALHDDNSHGADAFRQFGQEADNGNMFPAGQSNTRVHKRRRRGGMAA